MLAQIDSDAVAQSYSVKKVFLNVFQNLKEVTGLWLKRDFDTEVFM